MNYSEKENLIAITRAIFNQDEEKDKDTILVVYDMANCELPIALFKTSKLCGEFLNLSRKHIDCIVCRKSIFRKRFKIKRINIEEI